MSGQESKTIISYKALEVRLTDTADEKIIALLENNTLGTRGGMRHQLMNIGERINAYGNNIRFASLYLKNRLTGTLGFCYRKIKTAGLYFHCSYLRYFSFMPAFQAALDSKETGKNERKKQRNDTWKDKVMDFIRKPYMLDFPGHEKDACHIIYAYVETRNERSKKFIKQVGFEHTRTFHTFPFSRFNPGRSPGAVKLQKEERGKMKELLSVFYSGYSFYSDDLCFHGDRYYVIKDGDEIVAGLTAFPSSFRIVDMPGRKGRISLKIFPYLPFLRKIFRPEELRFLVFEFMYYRAGYEKCLEELMESVCAIEGYKLGLSWQDEGSKLYDLFIRGIDMGTLNRLVETKPAMVLASFNNIPEDEKELFFSHPAYISGFDFT